MKRIVANPFSLGKEYRLYLKIQRDHNDFENTIHPIEYR